MVPFQHYFFKFDEKRGSIEFASFKIKVIDVIFFTSPSWMSSHQFYITMLKGLSSEMEGGVKVVGIN